MLGPFSQCSRLLNSPQDATVRQENGARIPFECDLIQPSRDETSMGAFFIGDFLGSFVLKICTLVKPLMFAAFVRKGSETSTTFNYQMVENLFEMGRMAAVHNDKSFVLKAHPFLRATHPSVPSLMDLQVALSISPGHASNAEPKREHKWLAFQGQTVEKMIQLLGTFFFNKIH